LSGNRYTLTYVSITALLSGPTRSLASSTLTTRSAESLKHAGLSWELLPPFSLQLSAYWREAIWIDISSVRSCDSMFFLIKRRIWTSHKRCLDWYMIFWFFFSAYNFFSLQRFQIRISVHKPGILMRFLVFPVPSDKFKAKSKVIPVIK
jgi:hypothetical protein